MPINSKLKRLYGLASFALVASLAFEGLRTLEFFQTSKKLIERSNRFPREYQVGSGEPMIYVSLGDSTAQGVGVDDLSETLPYQIASRIPGRQVKVINLAKSGAVLKDVLMQQVAQIPAGPIDLVTISISANDVVHDSDAITFRLMAKTLLDELSGRHVKRVVMSTPPNFRHTPAVPFPFRRILFERAARLRIFGTQLYKEFPNVRWVDLFLDGTIPSNEYAEDGFHPSAVGYARWADLFAAAALDKSKR